MRELELKFNGKGSMKPFRFQQINKGNNAYIYMVEIIENPSVRWYEVFRRRECSDTDVVLNGQTVHYEARVLYPTANDFGVSAFVVRHLAGHWSILTDGRMEEKIDRILALLEENNEILKEIKSKIEMSESEECVTKRTLHDFINNVVADLFADMLLQPKGRGHVSREDIMQFINKMK